MRTDQQRLILKVTKKPPGKFIFVKIHVFEFYLVTQSENEKVSRRESENEKVIFFKQAERGQIENLEPAFNVAALTTNLGSKQYHRVLFFSNKN
jgi:hypothetical protein